jgi:hypothetical protein
MFLPAERRRAITALYAFCREVDDVVDETTDTGVARTKLAWWRTEVANLFAGHPQHPVTRALQPFVQPYGLDAARLNEIIDGMEMDLTFHRYPDFDSLKLYWPELPNPKHVLYVPNQGHSLRDIQRVIGSLSAVHRYAAAGKLLPQTTWSFSGRPDTLGIQVRVDRHTDGTLIWSAHSPTLDFREARWTSRKCAKTNGGYACSVKRDRPAQCSAPA